MKTLLVLVLPLIFFLIGVAPARAQQEATSPNLFQSLGSLFKADAPAQAESAPDPAPVTRAAGIPAGEKRVALVIGNNAYRHVSKLDNAVADARAMAREFRGLGFEVIEKTDIDQRGMKAAVREFVGRIANGGVGAFFFAGHGVQDGGNNYLLPVDISALTDAAALPDEAVELNGEVMSRIGQVGAKFSLLVVDACRDNPFPKKAGRSVGGTRGLTATPNAPEGMIVVYSAGVGQQALDRLGDHDRDPNGLFTREFIRELRNPGMEVAEVVRNVRKRVKDQAARIKHEQTPAIYIQADRFYFIPDAQSVTIQQPAADPEDTLWAQFDPARPCEYQAYLDQYPKGKFAGLARLRLKDCAPASAKPAEPVPPPPEPPKAEKVAVPPAPTFEAKPDDPEGALWAEVKNSGVKEYYEAYLKDYPKGKYASLARVELGKIAEKEKAQRAKEDAERKAELARQEAERQASAERDRQQRLQAEQAAWDAAKSTQTAEAYAGYLSSYPQGRYASLAQAARQKAEREAAEREKQAAAQHERESREAEQRRQAEAERQRMAAELARQEAEKAAKEMRPGKVFTDCPDCPEMVMLPGNIAMGRTEVTQRQWRAVMGSDPPELYFKGCDDCPVENVSWNDAQDYLKQLNRKTGKTYRLPSEAEWERACRAGSQQEYCGSDTIDSVAWYAGNSGGKTRPVAGKQPNAWGLYDMSGNVWEWTDSCWDGDCGRRVLRGGSWGSDPQFVRAADRYRYATGVRLDDGGFRLARTLP